MLRKNSAPLNGVENQPEDLKSIPQPGIQLPPSNSITSPGTASPDLGSRRSSFDSPRSRSRDVRSPVTGASEPGSDVPRDIIVESFAPRVAVYPSADTDELIRLKGLYGGLCALLRPFGESIQGKIIIRDSIGASKSWNDFGVCFTEFDKSNSYRPNILLNSTSVSQSQYGEGERPGNTAAEESRALALHLDDAVRAYMRSASFDRQGKSQGVASVDASQHAPYFDHFLLRLLSGRPMVPHETYTHPVACVIAISSQNTTPIDTLRDLYNDTRQESENAPGWAGSDFLRYYVLIHDEDHDDIAKSTALFNQMKRHFGLHCHLLRLRSSQCAKTDDDSYQIPASTWLSAEEELTELKQKGDLIEFDEFQQYIYDSDATALATFVREMVTQSVIPFMENRVTTWNDQVASRRRGISGRFMSMSKRFAGFGSLRGNRSSELAPSKSNYNAAIGAYPPDSNESAMHRLADYAFMLRDWKLSSSIYDILRTDFADDKAWYHHAVVNEMTAVSLLLSSHSSRSTRVETIEQLIDTATYSYLTRCANPFAALRCLVMVTELFRSRGGSATEEASKWGDRLLELTVLTPLMQSIMVERLAVSFHFHAGGNGRRQRSRNRKAAMWHMLAAEMWLRLSEPVNARAQLDLARFFYGSGDSDEEMPSFNGVSEHLAELHQEILRQIPQTQSRMFYDSEAMMDEETKTFDNDTGIPSHTRRFSTAGPPPSGVDPLHQFGAAEEKESDGFT